MKHRKFDILIWIVIAALIGVFAMNNSSPHEPLAFSSQTQNSILITEIMPSNMGTITNRDGEYCDWIEIMNPTDQPIDMNGYSITDDPSIPNKHIFPDHIVAPGEFVIIYADNQLSTDKKLHVPFKLSNKGEMLFLFDAKGTEVQRISFPDMETNHSFALDPAASEWSSTDRCTPGFPNTDDGYAIYQQNRCGDSPVMINEVMASNAITLRDEDDDYPDWIELYNRSEEAIDLTGWGLSYTETNPKRWEFPATQIGPGEYLIVYMSGKNRAEPGKALHSDFKLNALKDTLLLSNYRGQIISEVQINEMKSDASYGFASVSHTWQAFSQSTPGQPNDIQGWNAYQPVLYTGMDSPIVISEVMSNNVSILQDKSGEYPDWIELYNRSAKSVNLKGWSLADSAVTLGQWQFPDIVIEPGEYLIVFASGRDIRDEAAIANNELHTDFGISSAGEPILLGTPDGDIADRCFTPPLRTGISYHRLPGDSSFIFCDQPSPGTENTGGYPGMANEPVYSIKAGMYDDVQQVELLSGDPNVRIHYTINGSTPDENAIPYTGPITIEKTTAIRAVAYREGYLPSNTVCATYLIGENIGLPVVSIVTDPANLFDEETGIYMDGPGWTEPKPHYGANYWQDWERPAHMELLEPDGTVGISQDIGIKIFGGYSRAYHKKSLSLMSRGEYGNATFAYQVFPEMRDTSYKHLIIRNGAQDFDRSLIRTQLQTELIQETSDIDIQTYRQSILFINGEYWGIYGIMEKLNEHFIARHHGVDPGEIDLLEGEGVALLGSDVEYDALIEYVRTHDLSIQKYYEYVAKRIDIDNYIDWCTIEMYIANRDLCNIKFWRPQTPDGKWRWILYDLDWGFYHMPQEGPKEYLDIFKSFLNPKGYGSNDTDNSLILGLLENEGFRQKFIERFVYHCTVTFNTDKVLQRIDKLAATIEPYMQRNMDRWPSSRYGTMEEWQEHLQLIRDYAVERPLINLRSMQQYFGLTDAEMQKLLANTQILRDK